MGHVVVVIEGEGAAEEASTALTTFDFLPIDPTAPGTVIQMLLGGETSGEIREQLLSGKQPRASWELKGSGPNCVERARAFSSRYSTRISLFGNNCVTYADDLVSHLLQT